MVKDYGILQAVFNLDNDINLNRAFSEPWSIHNPILKSVDSSKDQLNANFLIYSFYHADSLEHIPQINIKNTNQYNGLDAVNSTKLKYIQIKSSNKLSTEAKFQDTKLLEKIDLDKESDYKQGDYLNNESLRMLPKGSFSQSTDLTNFLTNAIKLENTDLDLSSATNLTKLDIYGTSTKRIDGLKSLIVSNEAPFDGNSPQINVSYTGLNKNALVNLFNTLPYNVGYSIVGNPIITDGIASGFSYSNRLNIISNVANADITEMVWKFKLDSSGLKNNYNFLFYKSGGNLQLSIYGTQGGSFSLPTIYIPGPNQNYFFTNFSPVADTWYWLKYTYDGSTINLYSSTDGTTYTLRNAIENVTVTGADGVYQVGWGSSQDPTSTQYFSGSIDLNETYIKVSSPISTGPVEYTVVGSPTIAGGVVSGFSSSNYLSLPNSPTGINTCSYKITATINSIPSSGFPGIYTFFGQRAEVRNGTAATATLRFYYPGESSTQGDGYFVSGVALNVPFSIEVDYDGNTTTVVIKQNNNVLKNTTISPFSFEDKEQNIGKGGFDGSVDLNNTYIKVNGKLWFGHESKQVTWFGGKAAMTKTINVIECIGTADLTADDKSIVTNKGWTLQDS